MTMTRIHNRTLYLLAIFLLGGAVHALAGQVWTTVWTPDRTSTARANGGEGSTTGRRRGTTDGGDTHDSDPTKCYPCKEWEDYGDGTGKWVYYDEGTVPTDCGNGTDYTCIFCDGEGGTRKGHKLDHAGHLMLCDDLKPADGYSPSVSTPPCGPDGSPVSLLLEMYNDCCAEHDLCYGTCSDNSKEDCDDALESCMIDKAFEVLDDEDIPDAVNYAHAVRAAFSTDIISSDMFDDARVDACVCCDIY